MDHEIYRPMKYDPVANSFKPDRTRSVKIVNQVGDREFGPSVRRAYDDAGRGEIRDDQNLID